MATDCLLHHRDECDAVLSTPTVIATLHDHGIATRFTADGRVEAWEAATVFPFDGSPAYDDSKWVPVPHGVHDLADWLGY